MSVDDGSRGPDDGKSPRLSIRWMFEKLSGNSKHTHPVPMHTECLSRPDIIITTHTQRQEADSLNMYSFIGSDAFCKQQK